MQHKTMNRVVVFMSVWTLVQPQMSFYGRFNDSMILTTIVKKLRPRHSNLISSHCPLNNTIKNVR